MTWNENASAYCRCKHACPRECFFFSYFWGGEEWISFPETPAVLLFVRYCLCFLQVIVETVKPEWDGGSRGKVKTKGKRGKGFV